MTSNQPEKHEIAHQMCLLASVLFSVSGTVAGRLASGTLPPASSAGAMGYRAGSNPYTGPGGTMLAALGGVSAAYHLVKFTEFRNYEMARVTAAEQVLRERDFPAQAPPSWAAGPIFGGTPPVGTGSAAAHSQRRSGPGPYYPGGPTGQQQEQQQAHHPGYHQAQQRGGGAQHPQHAQQQEEPRLGWGGLLQGGAEGKAVPPGTAPMKRPDLDRRTPIPPGGF